MMFLRIFFYDNITLQGCSFTRTELCFENSFCLVLLKELCHGQRILKKLTFFSSLLVVIGLHLRQSKLTILGYFRVFIIPLVFFIVKKLLF